MSVVFRYFRNLIRIVCVFCVFIGSALSANNLPSEYTELKYIESTGTQWIDTGVYWKNGYSLDMNFTSTSSSDFINSGFTHANNFAIFGASNGNSYYDGEVSCFWYDNAFDRVVPSSDTTSSQSQFGIHSLNTIYNLKYNNSATIVTDGTNTYQISNGVYTNYIGAKTIYLCSTNRGVPYTQQFASRIKIHDAKIYNESGTLVSNFIPARRNNDYVVGMYDTVTNTFFTNSGTGKFIAGPVLEIKIATTKYIETAFADSVSELNTTMGTIKNVVDNTIIQADRIGKLHTGKQTRPDGQCPANAQCLLITEPDGSLHWYPICNVDGSIFDTGVFLSQLTSNGNDYYFHRNTTTYNELGGSGSAGIRQPSLDSIVRQLNDAEWAVLWNYYGVVYGTSVCNSNSGKLGIASTTEQTETKGRQCWCKMTSVGDIDKVEHGASGVTWFLYNTNNSATDCAYNCSFYCAHGVQVYTNFRSNILNTKY